jgi:2-hydroxychromene-2-carboxylate isomerase
MFEQFLKAVLKAAFPKGLKVQLDQAAGKVSILTGTDQIIKQLSFAEAEQFINSYLGDIQT